MNFLTEKYFGELQQLIKNYVLKFGKEYSNGLNLDIIDYIQWDVCPGANRVGSVQVHRIAVRNDNLYAVASAPGCGNKIFEVNFRENPLSWIQIADMLEERYGQLLDENERLTLTNRPMTDGEKVMTASRLTLMAFANRVVEEIVVRAAHDILRTNSSAGSQKNPIEGIQVKFPITPDGHRS